MPEHSLKANPNIRPHEVLDDKTLEFAKKSLEANLQSSGIEVDNEINELTQEARRSYNEYIKEMGGEYLWLTGPGTLEEGLVVARQILKGMNSRERQEFNEESRRSTAHDALENFVENYEQIYKKVEESDSDEIIYDGRPYNEDKELQDVDESIRTSPDVLYQMSLDQEKED